MMGEEICSTGKWVDNETGQVVDSEPRGWEGGRLLVAPGGVVTPSIAMDIAAAERLAAERRGPDVETATESEPDKTSDAPAEETTTDRSAVQTAVSTKGRSR